MSGSGRGMPGRQDPVALACGSWARAPWVPGREAWTGSGSDSRGKQSRIQGRIPGTSPAASATSPGTPPYTRTPRPAWPRSPNRPHLCCPGCPGHTPRVSILTQPDPIPRPAPPGSPASEGAHPAFLPVACTERRHSGVPDLGADFPPSPFPPHSHSPANRPGRGCGIGAGSTPSSGGGGALAARSARVGRSPHPAPTSHPASPPSRFLGPPWP